LQTAITDCSDRAAGDPLMAPMLSPELFVVGFDAGDRPTARPSPP
jgi:hypothetical protein